jgi:outer membrane protein, heavy metal efflux system
LIETTKIIMTNVVGSASALARVMKTTRILIMVFWALQASAQIRTPEQGALPDRLTIDQAVAEALENNIGLLAERYNVSIAQARLITARLRPNPVLSLSADLLNLPIINKPDNNAGPPEYIVNVNLPVERGGKRDARIEVAQNSISAAEFRLRNAMRSVVLDTQSAFVDVLLAREMVNLARQNYEALNNVVQINTVRVRAGDLAEVDLLRSRVATLQYENSVSQAELRLKNAYQRLRLVIGRGITGRPIEAIGELRRDVEMVRREAVLQEARQLRPDLLAQRQEQARSLAELRLQIATGKVDYAVGTEYRRQQGAAGTGNNVGFFFSMPLPVRNKNQGEIERARREQDQINLQIRAMEQSVDNEVDTSYEQYLTSRTLVETFEKTMLQQAQDVRRISEYSYTRGEATLVEFLDAQRAFNDTMQGYNEARAEFARQLYQLDSVSGKSVNGL